MKGKVKNNLLNFKVMHSKIFQITQTRVDKDNYLNEDTLMQGDNSHFDYCAEIDNEERKEYIGYLVNHVLPKGMFELTSEDTILYKGGTENGKKSLFPKSARERKPLPLIRCRIGLAPFTNSKNS